MLLFGSSGLLLSATVAPPSPTEDVPPIVDITADVDAARAAPPWNLLWRSTLHRKEVKAMCFTPDSSFLVTAASDGQCLLWPAADAAKHASSRASLAVPTSPEPTPVPPPPFTMHNAFGGGSKKSKQKGGQWRCLAIPSESTGGVPLIGVLNHQGGPGWVARYTLGTSKGPVGARLGKYVKVSSSPLTALDVSADGCNRMYPRTHRP